MSAPQKLSDEYSYSNEHSMSSSSHYSQIENEVKNIQDAILKQGQEVEQFIKQREKQKEKISTAEFSYLQALFELFKSEIKMNLSLRSALMTEKSKVSTLYSSYTESDSNLKAFLDFFSQQVGKKIQDLTSAAQTIMDLNQKSVSQDQLKQLQQDNKNFYQQLTEMKKSFDISQAQNTLELAKYVSMAESAQSLSTELNDVKLQYSALQEQNNQLQKSCSKLQEENDHLHISLSKTQYDNDQLQITITSLQNENDQIKREVSRSEEIINDQNKKISEYENVLIAARKKLNEQQKQSKKENDETEMARKKIGELRDKVCHLEEYQQQLINQIQSQSMAETKKSKNHAAVLQTQLKKMENRSSQMASENERLRVQLRQSLRQIQQLEEENSRLQVQLEENKYNVYEFNKTKNSYQNQCDSNFSNSSYSQMVTQSQNNFSEEESIIQKPQYPKNGRKIIVSKQSENDSIASMKTGSTSSSSTPFTRAKQICDRFMSKDNHYEPSGPENVESNCLFEKKGKNLKEEVLSLKNELIACKEAFSTSSLS